MSIRLKILFFAFVLAFTATAFASAAPSAAISTSVAKNRPKMRVAVAKFGATDRFASVYGGWDIGGGLAAQLVTELIKTGRVTVVERAILSKVLVEQELGESNLLAPMTRSPSGQLLGVDYLIVGEVTEFEERQMSGGVAAGFLGIRAGSDISAAHVGIDLRLVDTRTGEILHSYRAQGKAWEKAVGTKIDYKVMDFGGDLFHKTPLGLATRHAIDNAVAFILDIIDKQFEDISWLGLVVESGGGVAYLNAGANKDISTGDRFRISAIEKVLTDPETNQIIGLLEHDLGQAEAVFVDRKYTKMRLLGNFMPHQGDIVRFADKARNNFSQRQQEPAGYEMME